MEEKCRQAIRRGGGVHGVFFHHTCIELFIANNCVQDLQEEVPFSLLGE